MNAPLQTTAFASTEAERRREQRIEARDAPANFAMLSMNGKAASPALVSDASVYGCCVETRADWLRPGRFVAITLPNGAVLESIVRWTATGIAGLELLRPLDADGGDLLALAA